MENTMNRIPYDSYNEKGIFMKKNIELDQKYEESQQPINVLEVPMALDNLNNRIFIASAAIDSLKERLYPILPPESKNEETKCIEYNIKQPEFSCPLAKELETDCCKISEITEIIRYLLENLKL